MARLRHIAMSVPDPDKAADFYCDAFGMERVGTTDSTLAKGVYISDGVITVALLNYKNDRAAGYVEGEDERGANYVGIHHIGFWVDDLKDAEDRIEKAGGKYFMGRPEVDEPTSFYEMKFRDLNGVIVDCTHLGWRGSIKDAVAKEDAGATKKKTATQAAE